MFDRDNRLGANAGIHVNWKLYGQLGVVGKLAYKSKGYAMGLPLGRALHGYVGLSIAPDAEGALIEN